MSGRESVASGTGGGAVEPRWEVCYAVVFAVAVVVVEAGPLDIRSRIVAGAALAAMACWYGCAVRPLTRRPQAYGVWRPVCLTVLLALFAVVQSRDPTAWFLAFALTPMGFRATRTMRGAMVFVVALNAVGAALVIVAHPGADGVLGALAVAAFSVVLAYVVRRWMLRVTAQSEERAALIAQLESTRAQLAAAHHEAGVLAERHRLAGEIHDTLAQGFTSIVTLVQAASAGLDDGHPAHRHLEWALATARENLAEARSLVSALGPEALRGGGLPEAVERAARMSGGTAEVTGEPRVLPTGTQVVLLRVCQEALANARKHAQATRIAVRLAYGEGIVCLEVADDGRGFEETGVVPGYGLRGMRERVRQAGGAIEVRSAVGEGTTVRVEVPG
ncbi:sensor histidine kinase [Streptantibioticus parmotrematis]|uniref:sensor histidine kinase n=1 Tax=Streptantibioticus parmotrematis TaxID=2873249 RepID=UPI0033F0D793